MCIGKWQTFRIRAQVLNCRLNLYGFHTTINFCVCFCITQQCLISSKLILMFLFKGVEGNERAFGASMISSISVWHLFKDELDIGNSEIIWIFQWPWEAVLSGDTPVAGSFGVKVQPPQMELPIKEQHLERHPWCENPAPVLQRALKEPCRLVQKIKVASPEREAGHTLHSDPSWATWNLKLKHRRFPQMHKQPTSPAWPFTHCRELNRAYQRVTFFLFPAPAHIPNQECWN